MITLQFSCLMLVNHKILLFNKTLFRLCFIKKNNWGGGANEKIFEGSDW